MAIIKINKHNFYYNLNQIVLQAGSVDKIAIVLKDNAYGHGLELIAALCVRFGIRHAVVRTLEEAKQIHRFFETILILGDVGIKDEKYSFAINTLDEIQKAEKGSRVELKIDTGMHRNGVALDEIEEALQQIKEKGLALVGVMTHYRAADLLSSEFFWQQKQFEKVKQYIRDMGYTSVRFHSHNSASILRNKNFSEDLIRVGIGAYGYNELPSIYDKITLRPVLSLHAQKISTRQLQKGQRIGYGGDFVVPRKMQVSTYNLGYGDGWIRGEYQGTLFMTAEHLPILGRVSMDFVSLESDQREICIFDNAQNVAQQLGTISYEVTTRLSRNIKRVVV